MEGQHNTNFILKQFFSYLKARQSNNFALEVGGETRLLDFHGVKKIKYKELLHIQTLYVAVVELNFKWKKRE